MAHRRVVLSRVASNPHRDSLRGATLTPKPCVHAKSAGQKIAGDQGKLRELCTARTPTTLIEQIPAPRMRMSKAATTTPAEMYSLGPHNRVTIHAPLDSELRIGTLRLATS